MLWNAQKWGFRPIFFEDRDFFATTPPPCYMQKPNKGGGLLRGIILITLENQKMLK